MGREQGEADHGTRKAGQQTGDRQDIAETLGHLLARDMDHAVMEPCAGIDAARGAASRLGDLVFMVRKDEVGAAAVNVEITAEDPCRHRCAFDMPARAPPSPGTVPAGRVAARGFPEHEVGLVALERGGIDPGMTWFGLGGSPGQPSRRGIGLCREEDMACGCVGGAGPGQPRDILDHGPDVVGRPRLPVGQKNAESPHIGMVPVDRRVGQDPDRVVDVPAGETGGRGLDDLVVDVGEIPRIEHAVLSVALPQGTIEHVEDDGGPGISEMRAVVDRGAADIDADPRRVERPERGLPSGSGIGEADVGRGGHRDILCGIGGESAPGP